ncbi:MAG: HemK/PrmC family methyltransferase [Solirubrobacterales bacterium]
MEPSPPPQSRSAQPETVGAALEAATETIAAAGCDRPREDAEALIADALGADPRELSRDGAGELSPELAAAISERVRRRAEHEPLAYILGRARFCEIEVGVDSRVLIPRRETELLVGVAAELPEGSRVHEVGTGSGAIALALIHERPDLRVSASDLSPDAAQAAGENARRLGLELEVIVEEGMPERFNGEQIDLVLANLPYVTDSTIFDRSPEIQREPRIAVTGECGEDGLGVIRGLIAEVRPGQRLAMEHDTHHGPAMREMLREARTIRDHMGGERVTVGFAP